MALGGDLHPARNTLHERRLAGAERADQRQDIAGRQRAPQPLADRLQIGGGGRVRVSASGIAATGSELDLLEVNQIGEGGEALAIWARSRRLKRSRLKSSTENEASTEPRIIAVRMVEGWVPPRAIHPMKPPPNESPAPVGSTTFSIGKAGAAKTPPRRTAARRRRRA